MTVELLYEKECPNVAAARANLDRAFALAGLPHLHPQPPGHAGRSPARTASADDTHD